ncbi:hypothetical protein [Streptodolium elevatio]|uniref:4Fe-4S Wbl-type domain-containing protein n=1 Tax=Streptodolium elevatio TaxID=3157996 RepID=A0ABV3DL63_9ACTN
MASTPPSAPTMKRRPRRTRTKNRSLAAALVASKLCPNDLDLRRGAMTVVCPDCRTWCPITGYQGQNPKLTPHQGTFADQDGNPVMRRCEVGSNRRIVLDLTIERWQRSLAEAARETSARRATAVVPRPKAAPAPAASQIQAPLLKLAPARDAHLAHRARCAACQGRTYCTDGLRLADLYVRLLRQDPERSRRCELLAEVTADQEQRTARQFPRARAEEWADVLAAFKAVEDVRDTLLADTSSDGTNVPHEPLRIAV